MLKNNTNYNIMVKHRFLHWQLPLQTKTVTVWSAPEEVLNFLNTS